MDEQHHIQHIVFEYALVVCAIPKGDTYEIQSGYGSMCPWNKEQRLEAYKGIKGAVEEVIEGMEAGNSLM